VQHRIFSKKTSTKKDGVAIFWIKDKFNLMAIESITLDDPIGDENGKIPPSNQI
jgi:hypothetical protein